MVVTCCCHDVAALHRLSLNVVVTCCCHDVAALHRLSLNVVVMM